uniref:Spp2/MOS2 G-patch domain-containing protein n=1 Tax=Globisporangium ultimum (strain ATCC 200006 / CBS 805.95 / DAOM BR144) TaxID=431595 RepID=K3WC34_GLOUD
MKLGFSLKKARKPALQAAAAPSTSAGGGNGASSIASVFSSTLAMTRPAVEKVFVTDFDPNARQDIEFDEHGNAKKSLVIPLIKANAWKTQDGEDGDKDAEGGGDAVSAGAKSGETDSKSTQDDESEASLTADELAAKKLLEDAASHVKHDDLPSSHASTLVIPMNTASASASANAGARDEDGEKLKEIKAKLFNFEEQAKNKKQEGNEAPTAPILKQNVVPGMDELNDVNEKYRLDVSMRPDELDVHSSAYEMVPIEDFGAALLRGMGWKGSVDKDDKSAEPKPRHKLLGLGATIRPPMAGDNAKNKHKKKLASSSSSKPRSPEKPRQSGLNHTEKSKDRGARHASRSRSPRRSNDRENRKDRRDDRRRRSLSRERRSSRDDDRDRSRQRDDRHGSSASSSRRRSHSRDRTREHSRDDRREKERDSEKRRDRDGRRKRSRSRDRPSDRKRSSRR